MKKCKIGCSVLEAAPQSAAGEDSSSQNAVVGAELREALHMEDCGVPELLYGSDTSSDGEDWEGRGSPTSRCTDTGNLRVPRARCSYEPPKRCMYTALLQI